MQFIRFMLVLVVSLGISGPAVAQEDTGTSFKSASEMIKMCEHEKQLQRFMCDIMILQALESYSVWYSIAIQENENTVFEPICLKDNLINDREYYRQKFLRELRNDSALAPMPFAFVVVLALMDDFPCSPK